MVAGSVTLNLHWLARFKDKSFQSSQKASSAPPSQSTTKSHTAARGKHFISNRQVNSSSRQRIWLTVVVGEFGETLGVLDNVTETVKEGVGVEGGVLVDETELDNVVDSERIMEAEDDDE